jgi:hypothetical protein
MAHYAMLTPLFVFSIAHILHYSYAFLAPSLRLLLHHIRRIWVPGGTRKTQDAFEYKHLTQTMRPVEGRHEVRIYNGVFYDDRRRASAQ